jgi:hypothetical protein
MGCKDLLCSFSSSDPLKASEVVKVAKDKLNIHGNYGLLYMQNTNVFMSPKTLIQPDTSVYLALMDSLKYYPVTFSNTKKRSMVPFDPDLFPACTVKYVCAELGIQSPDVFMYDKSTKSIHQTKPLFLSSSSYSQRDIILFLLLVFVILSLLASIKILR